MSLSHAGSGNDRRGIVWFPSGLGWKPWIKLQLNQMNILFKIMWFACSQSITTTSVESSSSEQSLCHNQLQFNLFELYCPGYGLKIHVIHNYTITKIRIHTTTNLNETMFPLLFITFILFNVLLYILFLVF